MSVAEAIALALAVRATSLDEGVLTQLLMELEGRIELELHEKESFAGSIQLSVPLPWSRVYWTYLVAMIDLAAGDMTLYERSHALFRSAFDAYARYLQRTGARS